MKKTKVGIIGTGNIGTDLLMKIQRSPFLECSLFMGRRYSSKGMRIASEKGIPVTDKSINALIQNHDQCDIIFDASTAKAHRHNAPILKRLKKFTIDLTPSLVGKMCIPAINLDQCLDVDNVNLVTCGGQATVPIAYAISEIHSDVRYFEIVAAISSKSAGAGTRANIDEFTQTTKQALIEMSHVDNAKAIIIINPAKPPILMHNTLYTIIQDPQIDKIQWAVSKMAKQIQKYVPGYEIIMKPTMENNRVTTMVQVDGRGDYLPKYSGNLDIITCAALHVAETYVKAKL
jgi:acetaldehyde dehydrogenase (acetylating)